MGRLEEVVSPAKWPRIEEPFRQVREGAIENLPEDLSCLIDKSVRGYLCSSRRRERGREGGRGGGRDWSEFLEDGVWLLCGKNGEHK